MNPKKDKILITGVAGFIGAATAIKFLEEGYEVIGVDNINNYYDVNLKEARLNRVITKAKKLKCPFKFYKCAIEDSKLINEVFSNENPTVVVNLAAQAGVRYSLVNPHAYFQTNLFGFCNILEAVKKFNIKNFIFASSSSVYGGQKITPFKEDQKNDYPFSLYAATKKSNELLAHAYSHLYDIPSTGLRFFTVYGPWGRPDMAPMIFINSILNNEPIKVFNHGKMRRDFTYIDDIVEGVFRCCLKPATSENLNGKSSAPYKIFNIGKGKPIELMNFINILENKLDLKAIKNFQPMQPGDVEETYSDTEALEKWINYSPTTDIEEGLEKFVSWYKGYYVQNL